MSYKYINDKELDRRAMAMERNMRAHSVLDTDAKYNNSCYGSADLKSSSFDAIFASYHDYRISQQWG